MLGKPKNSFSHSKLILCFSLPNFTPYNKFHPNRMKNAKVWIFKNLNPQFFFEKSAKAKILKLEPFAWSHWIRKYLFYFKYQFRPRSRPATKIAQLSQTFPREKWKTSLLNKDQKVKLVIWLFSDKAATRGRAWDNLYEIIFFAFFLFFISKTRFIEFRLYSIG